MIACTLSQLSSHQSKNFFPKITHESTISITYNALGEPMQSGYFFEKISATCVEVKYGVTTNKWAIFFNLSTTTYMQSLPKYLGKPVMKSIEKLSHFCSGIGNGCNKPAGNVSYDLFCWHTLHSITYLWTSSFSPFQKNIFPQLPISFEDPQMAS